jgi:dipeptidyl-peptidase-4
VFSNNWSGSSFTQILTRAGYVVFQLDNRGSAFRGTRFQAPIHGNWAMSRWPTKSKGRAGWRPRAIVDADAHRRVGLELRRIHER